MYALIVLKFLTSETEEQTGRQGKILKIQECENVSVLGLLCHYSLPTRATGLSCKPETLKATLGISPFTFLQLNPIATTVT